MAGDPPDPDPGPEPDPDAATHARARLGEIAATLRAFLDGAGGFRAFVLLDQGEEFVPLVVDVPAEGPIELSEGEDSMTLDDLPGEPLPIPHVHRLPPLDVDAARAEISGPLGALDHLARAVRELAALFPGRSVTTVAFPTSDPDTPLTIAVRTSEPIVLGLGEEQFEMAPDWPS